MWKRDLTFGLCIILTVAVVVRYLVGQGATTTTTQSITGSSLVPSTDTDEAFRRRWESLELASAPQAPALTVARRISLALTGMVPSLEEIREFETQLNSTSREQALYAYIDRLLSDRRHTDYLAERLARVYVGTSNEPFLLFRRNRFVSWLSDELQSNVPYDELVRSLITARGIWTDSPEVNFITVSIGKAAGDRPDEVELASTTTRAFLGVRLDCMQCHDDNLEGNWLQSDFHRLAAFFAEASPTFTGIRDKEREYRYQYLEAAKEKEIKPQVPFESDYLPGDGGKRQRLANWITHPDNRAFSRTIVNRVWALGFGKPLVEPIDSIPLEGPFHPGMEALVDDFIAHEFDLHHLWQTVFLSDVFQRDSRANFEITTRHENEFAAFPLTRLRPEQVAGGILQSSRLTTIDAESHIVLRAVRRLATGDFVDKYGDTGEDEFESHGGTIPQRLLMLNGQLVADQIGDNPLFGGAARIAGLSKSTSDAVQSLFLTILTRRPVEQEQVHFESMLEKEFQGNRTKWAEHVAWTLINSTEFSWNH